MQGIYKEFYISALFSCYKVTWPLTEQKYVKKLTKSSDLCVAGKFGKQNGLLTGVGRDFQLQPRFHVGDHRWKFQTLIIPIWAGCKATTKTFHDFYVLMNIPRPVACFQQKKSRGT